jgi:dTDP-4-dehydrorhamnose 3,5-epimerase
VYPDERGFFREWFKASSLQKMGINFSVEQANFSVSKQGVIRGLHYSLAPKGQSKLVTCVQGEIMDVLVDIRVGSPTYLEHINLELNSNSGISILIATGVAHGFSVPKETSAISYLNSSEYSSKFERSINPLDDQLNLDWRLPNGTHEILSKSDASAASFIEARNSAQLPSYNANG